MMLSVGGGPESEISKGVIESMQSGSLESGIVIAVDWHAVLITV